MAVVLGLWRPFWVLLYYHHTFAQEFKAAISTTLSHGKRNVLLRNEVVSTSEAGPAAVESCWMG
jgi:hypothetical protein